MEHVYDMIVIGGGPAGYSAALYAARAGLDVVVIEKMGAGGQMALTDIIDNYPGFDQGIEGFALGAQMQAGAQRFGARTEYAEVTHVSLTGEIKRVGTTSGELAARTVVIATGAYPRPLGIEGEAALVGFGVHYCAHCDGRFYKDKTVMVVGGGNSAVEDALYLSRLAKKVYLVHRRDTLRAAHIYREQLAHCENVEIIWNSAVTGFVADRRLTGVQVKHLPDGTQREMLLDGLFVSIGRIPETQMLGTELARDEAGYILADESTVTNIPGVFAAGDVRTKALRQVVTAAADGAVAAHFAEAHIRGSV